MCSAVDEQSSEDARSRLVRGAVALVGEIGPTATTVRAVAERAGVSPPLVMHHFGSKDGLLAACDDHVRGVLEAAAAALVTGGASESTMSALLALPDVSAALSYVARSLLHDGEVGRWWFDEMLRLTLDGLADAEAVGLARPAADPLARAILLISMDLGMVLLRPLVEARLGGSLADDAIVERWTRAEMDLLSRGVLTPLPVPTEAVDAADTAAVGRAIDAADAAVAGRAVDAADTAAVGAVDAGDAGRAVDAADTAGRAPHQAGRSAHQEDPS